MSLANILAAKKQAAAEGVRADTNTQDSISLTVHKSQGSAWAEIKDKLTVEPLLASTPWPHKTASLPSIKAEIAVNNMMRNAIIESTPTAVELTTLKAKLLEHSVKHFHDSKPYLAVSDMEQILVKQHFAEREAKQAIDNERAEDFAQKIALARAREENAKTTEAINNSVIHAVAKMSLAEKLAMRKQAEAEAIALSELADDFVPEVLPDAIAADGQEIVIPAEDNTTFSLNITLNERQLMAKEFALSGKSYCFIGAAGTGKTTTQRSVAETLYTSGSLRTTNFKLQGSKERVSAPSIAFVAYTRRASANLARAIHKSPTLASALAHNVMTIHALLEFEPVTDLEGSFRFEPMRHAGNPLDITHLVIEEASMVGLDLWAQLYDALPLGVQIIFIGDINQLPPVFGSSILNYALVQLPVIELTEVYRNSGIVLASAHSVLEGKMPLEGDSIDDKGNWSGSVEIMRGNSPVQVGQEKMARVLGSFFKNAYNTTDVRGNKIYDPEDCIILSPWNKKALGTDNMNYWIAQFLGEQRGAVVHEIIAGFNKLYLAVGDKIMYNKQDGYITEINHNGLYHGKQPQIAGADLSRFGVRILGHSSGNNGSGLDANGDLVLAGYDNFSLEELEDIKGERKQQCSHVVKVRMETGQIHSLQAVGDFGTQVFSLGYALTVHKAQGCEWRKVFIILHKEHAVSLARELFYTAKTRAREQVVIIAKDDIIAKAVKNQRIKGNTLEEKVEYFNSGTMDNGEIYCTKG